METVYLVCALAGGTVLVIQFLLLMFGLDHHGDGDVGGVDVDLDGAGHGTEFFDYLSLKSVVAFLTFFGLAGLAMRSLDWRPFPLVDLVIALFVGCVAFYIVGLVMVGLSKLESSGNLDLNSAVGKTGTVYLRVPAARGGMGKVTVAVQSRLVEAKAITYGDELATGSQVQVIGLLKPDTLEVAPL